MVVLKTHIDFISDFGPKTIEALTALSEKHDFLIFEDRKLVDIGSTAQIQYARGDRRIHDWAHIVNACILAGDGTVQAIDQVMQKSPSLHRGTLILAEMTSKGSMATGDYTRESVQIARKYAKSVIGFVATRELSSFAARHDGDGEDLVVFTTGVKPSQQRRCIGAAISDTDNGHARRLGLPDHWSRDLCRSRSLVCYERISKSRMGGLS